VGSAAEEFVAVFLVGGCVAFFFQLFELGAVGGEVGFEVLETGGGFFLFGGVELVAGEGGVVVDCAGEGG
jgi:hypothetical protein